MVVTMPSLPSTSSAPARLRELLAVLDEAAQHTLSVSDEIKEGLTQTLAGEEKTQGLCDDLKKQKEQLSKDNRQLCINLEQSKREVEKLRAANEKADVTIKHHAENIAQINKEVQWWKERAEELKAEFKRADEERHKLSARVDELVSEQLSMSRAIYQPEPLTPRSQHAYNGEVSSRSLSSDGGNSAYSASASTSAYATAKWVNDPQLGYPARQVNGRTKSHKVYVEVPGPHAHPGMPAPQRKLTPGPGRSMLALPSGLASGSTSKSPRHVAAPQQRQHSQSQVYSYSQAQGLPQAAPRVIRRVHAVVESNVKEEEDSVDEELLRRLSQSQSQSESRSQSPNNDDAGVYDVNSASDFVSTSTSLGVDHSRLSHRNKISESSKVSRPQNGLNGLNGKTRKSGGARSANNDAQMYNADNSITRSHPVATNKYQRNEEPYTIDDDEDELTLGVETGHNEIYGSMASSSSTKAPKRPLSIAEHNSSNTKHDRSFSKQQGIIPSASPNAAKRQKVVIDPGTSTRRARRR